MSPKEHHKMVGFTVLLLATKVYCSFWLSQIEKSLTPLVYVYTTKALLKYVNITYGHTRCVKSPKGQTTPVLSFKVWFKYDKVPTT